MAMVDKVDGVDQVGRYVEGGHGGIERDVGDPSSRCPHLPTPDDPLECLHIYFRNFNFLGFSLDLTTSVSRGG